MLTATFVFKNGAFLKELSCLPPEVTVVLEEENIHIILSPPLLPDTKTPTETPPLPLLFIYETDEGGERKTLSLKLSVASNLKANLTEFYFGSRETEMSENPIFSGQIRGKNLPPHSTLAIHLGQNAHLEHILCSETAYLSRNIFLEETEAEYKFKGLLFPKTQHFAKLALTIHHLTADCQSNVIIRGLVPDKAKSSFLGKMIVSSEASDTLAHMENKNLLLGEGGECETEPQLEIYNEAIKCTHGATVSSLDEEALFYLTSRALSVEKARSLLISAFISPILNTLDAPLFKPYVDKMLYEYC